MPQIPIYRQQLNPNPVMDGTRMALQGDPIAGGLQDIGKGLGNYARMGMDEDRRKRDTEDRIQAAVLSSKFDAGMHDYLTEAQTKAAPGASGFTDNFYSTFDKNADAYETAAGSEMVRNLVRGHVASSRESFGRSAMHFEATERARNYGRQIDDGLETSAKLIRGNPDQFERQMGMWSSTISATSVPPEARTALMENARKKLAWTAVTGAIAKDPESFLLGQNRGAAFNVLEQGEQEKALEYADSQFKSIVSARLSQEAQAQKLAEKQEKEVYNFHSKEGDKLLASGKLSPKWIEANRDNMSAGDYRYFHKSLRSGGDEDVKTNHALYSDLRLRAGGGEDVRGDARKALEGGAIKLADFEKIVNSVESNSAIGTSWYKRGTTYIRETLKPSDLNYDPAGAQRAASALDDWTTWAAKNPNTTDDQAHKEYMRLTQEYGLIDYNQMTVTKRKPQFLVGGRAAPDIDATEDATVDAFESGKISAEELKSQSELIDEWRRATQRQIKQAKPVTK